MVDINAREHWHLDKKVPIGIIVALLLQTMTFIYVGTAWVTEVDFRIGNIERQNEDRKSQEGRIIVMEQQLRYISESLGRIERRLGGTPNGTQEN
jgi:hypothetical protein